MVKPAILVLGAVPAIAALVLLTPMLTKTEIPFSAANSSDTIEFEYTKHQLQKVSFGLTERAAATKTEILIIDGDGRTRYLVTENNTQRPEVTSALDRGDFERLKALIKETGFMAMDPGSFPISDNVTEYEKYNIKITLNGNTNQIHWPNQDATEKFIPPIITMVQASLDQAIKDIRE